ncbi:hypothetical protein [Vibrio mangrovi]|uniref:Uncharacterized protein n=1 Tax=Vibrio mangrovi TaxID=474394 RepID=A0A1Y6IQX6_9VIBR|nr:hypothetical protein [Vibrio mangrovi]MDW6004003.1 hypothetical protein [Vibrio mangrovi]SMR99200.1 hypothetical protein VIM7927_00424 [Vibrio mangrovi]
MTNTEPQTQSDQTRRDPNLHHTAREYLMILQGSCTEPSTNYCELWHVLTFLHNLITESENEVLLED